MNKKFLSAILFGALMVSSTGTFVSCKDYDDDIDELTSRVDGIESQIKDLEAKNQCCQLDYFCNSCHRRFHCCFQ